MTKFYTHARTHTTDTNQSANRALTTVLPIDSRWNTQFQASVIKAELVTDQCYGCTVKAASGWMLLTQCISLLWAYSRRNCRGHRLRRRSPRDV